MSVHYNYTVDDAVLRVFADAPKRQRTELLRIFDFLGNDPFLACDWVLKDSGGRPCQVKRFGPWLVTYWAEHIAKKVHVLDVERLV